MYILIKVHKNIESESVYILMVHGKTYHRSCLGHCAAEQHLIEMTIVKMKQCLGSPHRICFETLGRLRTGVCNFVKKMRYRHLYPLNGET